jgi:hypothetical protein
MLSATLDVCSRAWKGMVPLHAADLPCPIAAVIGSSHWRAVAMLSSVDSQEQG